MGQNEQAYDEPFRWKNCYADVGTYAHGRTVVVYVQDVVKPAIASLDTKIEELGAKEEGWAMFARADVEDLRQDTFLAFALALQSIWERQLRQYLVGCASELKLGGVTRDAAAKANWAQLRVLFRALRGIPIEDFPSFEELDILQLLGNACRHGEGPSAAELWRRRPILWPPRLPSLFGEDQADAGPQPPDGIVLTVSDLEKFATAVSSFWEDAEYIYNESISGKHASLERQLLEERAARSWRPRAADYR